MRKFANAMIFFVLLGMASSSEAHLENGNPRYWITFVGSHSFSGAPGSIVPQRFKVRIVDNQGRPAAGLNVWFGNNGMACAGGCPPLPPGSYYGSFEGSENPLEIYTDADGIATSPPYRIGTLLQDVYAGVFSFNPANANVGLPRLLALFHINNPVVEPPEVLQPPFVPAGDAGAVPLPLMSFSGLVALASVFAFVVFVRFRRLARRN
jgi:hypothetical protein